jgi:hypothetical protein
MQNPGSDAGVFVWAENSIATLMTEAQSAAL